MSRESLDESQIDEDTLNQFQTFYQQRIFVNQLTEFCFKRCISIPGSKFDDNEKKCLINCTGNYLEAQHLTVDRATRYIKEQVTMKEEEE